MAPVSAAKRQQKQRVLLREIGKYDHYKIRNAAYNRKYNKKRKDGFKNLLKEEKSKLMSEKRLKERLQQQKQRKLCQQYTPNINKHGYSSVQALSHATNKVRKYLPYSPSKQRAVIKTLANSLSVREYTRSRYTEILITTSILRSRYILKSTCFNLPICYMNFECNFELLTFKPCPNDK